MASLLPQFKSPSDSISIHFRIRYHTFFLRTRQATCFRSQCSLPMATTLATVVDMEKIRLSSLESQLSSVTAERPLTYTGAIGPPLKESLESSLITEMIPSGKEATIAAAAAEAIALAKAAAKVAKDAALMFGNETTTNSDHRASDTSGDAHFSLKDAMLSEEDLSSAVDHNSSSSSKIIQEEDNKPEQSPSEDSDPTEDELKYLQMQFSESIAVRSGRQTERRTRRAKAAGKAASGTVSVTSGSSSSSSRKKRPAAQEMDYTDPLRYLRGTTNTSRLLTANEELELSEGIQVLMKLESLHTKLKERCGSEPTFAQWANAAGVDQKTLRKRLNHGIRCKDRMIKSNIRLVISIAKNYQGAGMNLQDLVQEGCRGLVRGTEKFDPLKGFKFSTYAHWWIKQAVRKSLSDQSRTIRLPFHMVEATYRVREAKRQFLNENGKEPNDKEVADATGLTMKRLSAVMLTPRAPISLDQKVGLDGYMKRSEIIAHPDAFTVEEMLIKQYMKQDLDKVLNSLNPRENQVVRWRFGLEDGRMKTLQEIGELMGVSRERVRQIESSAFRKLKNKKKTKNLQQYAVSSLQQYP